MHVILTITSHPKKQFRTLCSVKKRRTELVNCSSDPKSFWQKIKVFSKTTNTNNDSACISSDSWADYFSGLFNLDIRENEQQDGSILDNLTREVNSDELSCPISREEIRQSVMALHSNHASGTDGLH